jgi:4-amino-4-deoxy-L-arabinose transferase-like glycosyltransferase
MKRTFWIYSIPLLLLLAVTLPHLEQGDFRVETAHYGAIGLQAWREPGLFWTLHEQPQLQYFNKPPLVFWIHGLFLHLFGITLSAARIPSILAAAGCVLITTSLAYRFMGRATALASGAILALTIEFFRRTREISLDLWQLFFMLCAVWLWAGSTRTGRRHWAWLAGIPLGLALMCKPLMALMVPGILIAWRFTCGEVKPGRIRDFALFLAVTLAVALPWHLSMIHLHGEAFTRQYLGHEVVQRMQGLRNTMPAWYYAVELGRSYWPWMILLVTGLVHWKRTAVSSHHRHALMGALLWIAVWAAVLTLFPDKRPRYALPLYPAMAILAGYGLASLPWKRLRGFYRHGLVWTAGIIVAMAITVALLPIRFQAPPDPALSALVAWVGKQDPATIYTATLSDVDESMLYLKTGSWPNVICAGNRPTTGSLLIYTDSLDPKPGPDERCVFEQPPYRVMRK